MCNVMDDPQAALMTKKSTYRCRRRKRHRFDPWVRKIPGRRKWQPTAAFMLEKFRGERSLVGFSPWRHRVGHD